MKRIISIAVATIALSACAHQQAGFPQKQVTLDGELRQCCVSAEKYPPWLISLAEPAAPAIGRAIGTVILRKGRLAGTTAQQEIVSALQPLDIVAVSSPGRLSGRMVPGLFSHVAIYLGTEAQLRRKGAWRDPRVVPHHAAIGSGAVFIEADRKGVHLSTARHVLDTDRVAVLRPRHSGDRRQRAAIAVLFGHLGSSYDFNFDNATEDALYCAELAGRAMPELGLPERIVYGRRTSLPDEIVAAAAAGRSRLAPILYVRPRGQGWEKASKARMVADIAARWTYRM